MIKKLFIFAVIMSGLSFVSMDGNCSEKYYSSLKMDNSEEENDNSISKEKDWGENPIFKLAKEFGIDVKDNNTNKKHLRSNLQNNHEQNNKYNDEQYMTKLREKILEKFYNPDDGFYIDSSSEDNNINSNILNDNDNEDKQNFVTSVDKIDYGNGYESPYD